MKFRKQNDNTYPILFLLTLSSDHITGATGKTPTLTISKNGAAFGAHAGAVTELANGWYKWTPAAADFDTKGELLLHASAADCDPYDEKYEVGGINLFDALTEISAAVHDYAISLAGSTSTFLGYVLSKLGLITAGSVQFTAPVDPETLALTIVRGDDYTTDSGRTLPEWESSDWTPLDLSAATSVTFKAKTRYGTVFSKAMDILSDTQVRLQLTTAETAALDTGTNAYRYDVEAVLSVALGSDIVTLAQGMMSVVEDVR